MTTRSPLRQLPLGGQLTTEFATSRGVFVSRIHPRLAHNLVDDRRRSVTVAELLPASDCPAQESARKALEACFGTTSLPRPLPIAEWTAPGTDRSFASIVICQRAERIQLGALPNALLALAHRAREQYRAQIARSFDPGTPVRGKRSPDLATPADVLAALLPSVEALVHQQGFEQADPACALRLRVAIDMAGFSYGRLATTAQIDKGRLARWARGDEEITDEWATRIARQVLGDRPGRTRRRPTDDLGRALLVDHTPGRTWLQFGGHSWWWAASPREAGANLVPHGLPTWANELVDPMRAYIADAVPRKHQLLVLEGRAIPEIDPTGAVHLQQVSAVKLTPLVHAEEIPLLSAVSPPPGPIRKPTSGRTQKLSIAKR